MKKSISWSIVLVLAAFLLVQGCASKKFVNTEVSSVDKKVASLSTEVEETQKRIKEHDEKLATIGELINQQNGQIKQVDGSNNEAKFAFNSAELSQEARAALDRFVQQLIEENRGVYIEIQGHTDNVGPEEVNLALGRKRAEAVMMYLYKTYQIPLYRMSVVSLGSSVPVADNSTREGRAQNRRVEILVYE